MIAFKAVHFHQQLVQRLLTLIVAAAQACAALAAHCVNLVDKDDARRVFLGLLKHIAHAACAHAHEHFHKIRTRNAEKRHARFARNGFGEQGFARARAACQQDAARHAPAQTLIAVGRFQIIHDFLHFFFGFVAAGHIGKFHRVGIFIQQLGAAFAKRKRAAFAAARLHPHKPHPRANQQ